MFHHKKVVPQNEPSLNKPEEYHPVILARLGIKFVSAGIKLPVPALIELGEHFIRILRGEPTEFSANLKATLYSAYSMKSSMHLNNCGFTNEVSSKDGEDEIAAKIIDLMKMSSATFGFQQMRLVLAVAEEINPSRNITNVDSFVFSKLKKEPFIDTAHFIINKLNAANDILINLSKTNNTESDNNNKKDSTSSDSDRSPGNSA